MWIVIGAVSIPFVLFGIEGLTGSELAAVATVDDRFIEPIEVRRAEYNLVQFYRNAYRDQFTPEVQKSLNLRAQALDGLVDRTVLLNQTQKLGIVIGDAELRDAIISDPSFLSDGRFDPQFYKRVVTSGLRLTVPDYEQTRRQDLAIQRLQQVVEDGVILDEAVVRDAVLAGAEKRTFRYVTLETSKFELEANVDDEEALQATYEANKFKYQIPERVKATLLLATPEAFDADIEIPEEEALAFYEENKDSRFTQPFEMRARHILIKVDAGADDEAKAEARERIDEIAQRARDGEDFEALARESSEDPGSAASGGDLGFFGKGRMVPEFEEAAFGLGPAEMSEVVESPFGFHLIRAEEVREERVKPFDEMREEIVNELKLEAGSKKAEEAAEAAQTALNEGKDLQGVATEYGLTVVEPEPFARNAMILEVGRSFPLANALFGLEAGSYTDAVDVEGKWVIGRLDEKIPPTIPPLEDVRMMIRGDLRRAEGERLGREAAEKLVAQARELGSLEKAAEADGLEVKTSEAITRESVQISGMGVQPGIRNAVFALTAKDATAPEPFTVLGDAIVVGPGETEMPSAEEIEEQSGPVRESLGQQARRELFRRYVDELKALADIRINTQLLEQLPPV